MSEEKLDTVISLLQEIRDGQKLQLQRQQQALEMQTKTTALAETQYEKADRLTTRAQAIQDRAARLVTVLAVIAGTLILWLLYRAFF
jgi:hypothetical protein